MKFPYGRYETEPVPSAPDASIIYRPVIPVRFIGTAGDAVFYGLLDTGADDTLITEEMAEALGVVSDAESSVNMLSASGEFLVRYGAVTIELRQARESYRWPAVVGIVGRPWREALLGHSGFLRYFDVTFFGEKREVRLRRNKVATV